MRPVQRKVGKSSFWLTGDYHYDFNTHQTIASIKGSTRKLGEQYKDATVVLYSKANLQPISIRKPDQNGDYSFMGLNTDLKTFVVAFDKNQKYNAVIQDNVVPK